MLACNGSIVEAIVETGPCSPGCELRTHLLDVIHLLLFVCLLYGEPSIFHGHVLDSEYQTVLIAFGAGMSLGLADAALHRWLVGAVWVALVGCAGNS
jgi:hypothetical protein